jgi:hypothetical protein
MMFVQVHASTGYIETYCDSTTNVSFNLLGYFTGTSFSERAATISAGTAATWTDYDIYTLQGVPKGAVAQICCNNKAEDLTNIMGVRTDGSALNRYVQLDEAESDSAELTDSQSYSLCVKVHASTGLIELYRQRETYAEFLLLGYFGTEMDYAEKTAVLTVSVAGWNDFLATSYEDVAGRVHEIFCGHIDSANSRYCGARIKGSALDRYHNFHEGEGTGTTGQVFLTQSDATHYIQAYYGTTSSSNFRWFGHFIYTESGATSTTHTFYSDSKFMYYGTISLTSSELFVLDQNLKARYDMDTLITTQLKDLSGYENHGTASGGITFSDVAGIYLDATSFDGSNDCVLLGAASSITNISSNALTIVAWVKPDTLTNALNPIIDDAGLNTAPYGLYITNDGKVTVRLKLSGTQYTKTFGAASSVATGVWTMIAFTFNGTTWTVYINKVAQTPQTQAGTLDTTSSNITLGRFFE